MAGPLRPPGSPAGHKRMRLIRAAAAGPSPPQSLSPEAQTHVTAHQMRARSLEGLPCFQWDGALPPLQCAGGPSWVPCCPCICSLWGPLVMAPMELWP